jgi:hypothetical protein
MTGSDGRGGSTFQGKKGIFEGSKGAIFVGHEPVQLVPEKKGEG